MVFFRVASLLCILCLILHISCFSRKRRTLASELARSKRWSNFLPSNTLFRVRHVCTNRNIALPLPALCLLISFRLLTTHFPVPFTLSIFVARLPLLRAIFLLRCVDKTVEFAGSLVPLNPKRLFRGIYARESFIYWKRVYFIDLWGLRVVNIVKTFRMNLLKWKPLSWWDFALHH